MITQFDPTTRPTRAGREPAEQRFALPDVYDRDQWLTQARRDLEATNDRKGKEALRTRAQAARLIRAIMLVDEQQDEANQQASRLKAAWKERDRLVEERDALRARLTEAQAKLDAVRSALA